MGTRLQYSYLLDTEVCPECDADLTVSGALLVEGRRCHLNGHDIVMSGLRNTRSVLYEEHFELRCRCSHCKAELNDYLDHKVVMGLVSRAGPVRVAVVRLRTTVDDVGSEHQHDGASAR